MMGSLSENETADDVKAAHARAAQCVERILPHLQNMFEPTVADAELLSHLWLTARFDQLAVAGAEFTLDQLQDLLLEHQIAIDLATKSWRWSDLIEMLSLASSRSSISNTGNHLVDFCANVEALLSANNMPSYAQAASRTLSASNRVAADLIDAIETLHLEKIEAKASVYIAGRWQRSNDKR